MSTVALKPVLWQQDPNEPQLSNFIAQLAGSSTYLNVLGEYGLQTLTARQEAVVSGTPPNSITDADLRTILRGAVAQYEADGGNPNAVAGDLFIFVLPSNTAFTATIGGKVTTLCQQASGYHSFLTLPNGPPLVYAVAEECANEPAPYPPAGIDVGTATISHEIAEAITDPFAEDIDPADNAPPRPAFNHTSDLAWPLVLNPLLGGMEIGDLCSLPFWWFRDAAGFMEEHPYDDRAAAAGLHPCGGGPYLGAAASPSVLRQLATAPVSGQQVPISGITIDVGSAMDVPLTFFDSSGNGQVQIKAIDLTNPSGASGLTLTLSSSSGSAGAPDTLNIAVHSAGSAGGTPGHEAIVISGYNADGSLNSLSPLFIASP